MLLNIIALISAEASALVFVPKMAKKQKIHQHYLFISMKVLEDKISRLFLYLWYSLL